MVFKRRKRFYNMEKLNDIYNESFKITDNILKNEKNDQKENSNLKDSVSQIFQKFIVEFTNSLNGIDNLKKTYKDDIPMKSQLDMIGNKLSNRLEKNE